MGGNIDLDLVPLAGAPVLTAVRRSARKGARTAAGRVLVGRQYRLPIETEQSIMKMCW